jgi:hypothetical protein
VLRDRRVDKATTAAGGQRRALRRRRARLKKRRRARMKTNRCARRGSLPYWVTNEWAGFLLYGVRIANPITRQNQIRDPSWSRCGAQLRLRPQRRRQKKSPNVATGDILVGGNGPFQTDLHGGLARCIGVDGEDRAGRCPVVGHAVMEATGRGGTSEKDSGGRCSSASPRSSHSESESGSQKRPTAGRRTTSLRHDFDSRKNDYVPGEATCSNSYLKKKFDKY